MATLGSRLLRQDRERFVGRARELVVFDQLLSDDPPANVVLLHGAGGIGKSTLLREVARRGEERGFEPFWVEGRELPPATDAVEEALAGARASARPLLLFDTYERMTALGGYLRRELLPDMPENAVVVLAGRTAPERAWFEGGWESLCAEVELRGLNEDEGLELLSGQGVTDPARGRELVRWSDGSPLALTLAASAGGGAAEAGDRREVTSVLVRRIADAELSAAHRSALSVAAIARVTTRDMLHEVLAETDTEAAYEWLATRTFAEQLGGGVTLHELVRRAMHSDLGRRDAERERELRRRIADHLYERAVAGDPLLSIDLAHLVENPMIRWGYGWEGSVSHRIDDVREADLEQLADHLAKGTHRYFHDAPERVAVARDPEDRLVGFVVAITPRNAPDWAWADPFMGPWLEQSKDLVPDGNAVLWRESVDLSGRPESGVQAMLGVAGILRSGLGNPRYAYMPTDPRLPGAVEFADVMGARRVEELDYEHIQCRIIDYGPGGLLGAQRDVVYRELGLRPPVVEVAAPASPDDVRDALRNMRLPHKLAESPLARGGPPEQRAESVRTVLRDAADRAFGDEEDDRLLRKVLDLGYLEPAPSHDLAAQEAGLSRAAYFRRLKQASERLAERVSQ